MRSEASVGYLSSGLYRGCEVISLFFFFLFFFSTWYGLASSPTNESSCDTRRKTKKYLGKSLQLLICQWSECQLLLIVKAGQKWRSLAYSTYITHVPGSTHSCHVAAPGFDSQAWRLSGWSLFSMCLCGFSLHTPASSYSLKTSSEWVDWWFCISALTLCQLGPERIKQHFKWMGGWTVLLICLTFTRSWKWSL